MSAALATVGAAVAARKRAWIAFLVAFVGLYYASLLGAMLLRFERLPNYITFYDWPGNVWRVFRGTPSLLDAFEIASDEWLIEIGLMNHAYGHGISEWSVTVLPAKLLLVVLAGALVASCAVLLQRAPRASCPASLRHGALAATGGGAFLVGLSSATLSWVVCCATPSWVVGMALLGMSTGLANWLEPLGVYMTIGGYALLAGAALCLARRRTGDAAPVAEARSPGAALSKPSLTYSPPG